MLNSEITIVVHDNLKPELKLTHQFWLSTPEIWNIYPIQKLLLI